METKPVNVIDCGDYVQPHRFENDREATLFYSYVDQMRYITKLEAINKELVDKYALIVNEYSEKFQEQEKTIKRLQFQLENKYVDKH